MKLFGGKSKQTCMLIFFLQISSCGVSKQKIHAPPAEKQEKNIEIEKTLPTPPPPPPTAPKQLTKEDIFNKIKHLISSDPDCHWIGLRGSFKNCAKENLTFNPAEEKKESIGKRILILDGDIHPNYLSSFFRYRDRILAYYHENAKKDLVGGFEEFIPKIQTHKMLIDINNILESAPMPFNSEDLAPIDEPLFILHRKINILEPKEREIKVHGEYIFELLADYIPDAQFVIVPFPELTRNEICRMDELMPDIEHYYQHSAMQLRRILKRHKINYINFSYGATLHSLRQYMQLVCPNNIDDSFLKNVLKIKADFVHEIIRKDDPYIMFHAVANEEPGPLSSIGIENQYTCGKQTNIIHIGSLSSMDFNIAAEGEITDYNMLTNYQKNVYHCGETFINAGYDLRKAQAHLATFPEFGARPTPEEPWWNDDSLIMNYFGVYRTPEYGVATSFVTPVALAFFIHLLNQSHEPDTTDVRIKILHSMRGKMFDPLKNKTLPRYTTRRNL